MRSKTQKLNAHLQITIYIHSITIILSSANMYLYVKSDIRTKFPKIQRAIETIHRNNSTRVTHYVHKPNRNIEKKH